MIDRINDYHTRSTSPYTQLPTRSKRSTVSDSRQSRNLESSPTKFLHPASHGGEHARNRSTSLPESAHQKVPVPLSANCTPRPSSFCTPSRLPRPSVALTPKSRHRPSASLDTFQAPMTPSTLKKPNKYVGPMGPGSNHRPRQSLEPASAPTSLVTKKPHPQPLLRLDLPPIPPIPSSTSLPVIPITVPEPRKFSKRDPKQILSDFKSLIGAEECGKVREYLPLDVMSAIHERELMERAARFRRAKSIRGHSSGRIAVDNLSEPTSVFGFPLRQIALYASTKAVLGGFEHNLPIVVFACVEELYRSGISTPSNPTPTSPSSNKFVRRTLSSSPPDAAEHIQPRVQTLLSIFDSPAHKFGLNASLKDEASNDIYALLTLFLSRLPEPVLAPTDVLPGLRNALWVWCVKPQGVVGGGLAAKTTTRIRIAQMLLGLLPTANLSLFVYLMAFSCQVLEVHMKKRRRASAARDSLACAVEGGVSALEAQLLAFERELEGKNERENEKRRLGMVWGVWLFGKDDQEDDGRSTLMMVWFVTHWGDIIRGFFERGISVDSDLALDDVFVSHGSPNLVNLPTTCPDSNTESRGPGGRYEITGAACTTHRDSSRRLHYLNAQRPAEESLFASSMSLNRLRLDPTAVSPDTTPKFSGPSSPLKIGLMRGLSYGRPSTQTLVPPEAEQEGSIHSRYSCRSSNTRHEREFEAIHMEREASPSQSSVSALDERLLDLRFSGGDESPTARTSSSVTSRSLNTPPSVAQIIINSDTEGKYPELVISESSDAGSDPFPGTLRVVNGCDTDSIFSRSTSASGSEYSSRPSPAEDKSANSDSRERPTLRLAFSSSGSSSESAPVSDKDVNVISEIHLGHAAFDDRGGGGIGSDFEKAWKKTTCSLCADDCPVHLYAKELEMQVEELKMRMKELDKGEGK
ncbi:hypothetical protein HHX47_DHR3000855 [Lentinula edodes]|nr:hypothetical protein HHX47_DHR3000855 [Lentinula edodes]